MTPAARVAAAVDVLDQVLAGAPAERTLLRWARASRFAGSRDREAVRDLVFDALRRRRSYAAMGGDESGRGLMLGALRSAGTDPDTVFTGEGYAPLPLTAAEREHVPQGSDPARDLDCPDWLLPRFEASLGGLAGPVLVALRDRAPVFVRVNLRRGTVDDAILRLSEDGIAARRHALSPTALEITGNARAVGRSAAYDAGLVELQDAASQAVPDLIPLAEGATVLDLCAGGGGKTLALAGRVDGRFFAHDLDAARMSDIPARAGKAGAKVTILSPGTSDRHAPYDVVVVDAPCSGSGAWRRSPEAKWRLTADRLGELTEIQGRLLDQAASLVGRSGTVAYITCSLLAEENAEAVRAFLGRNAGWTCGAERQFTPLDGGDGFYLGLLNSPD